MFAAHRPTTAQPPRPALPGRLRAAMRRCVPRRPAFSPALLPALLAATLAQAATETPLDALPYTPSLDVTAMDRSADPCDDLYRFACGAWTKTNPIPADQSRWSVYAKMANENQRYLWGVLQKLGTAPERSADIAAGPASVDGDVLVLSRGSGLTVSSWSLFSAESKRAASSSAPPSPGTSSSPAELSVMSPRARITPRWGRGAAPANVAATR